MGADNTEENMNKNSKVNSVTNQTRSSRNSEEAKSSGSSHSSRRSHSSSGGRKNYHGSRSSSKSTTPSTRYEKQKKTKLWLRSLFIALVCGCFVWLIVLIVGANKPWMENWNSPISSSEKGNIENLSAQLDALKTENMNLRYELDKYKKEYGEIDAGKDTKDKADISSKTTGTTAKSAQN